VEKELKITMKVLFININKYLKKKIILKTMYLLVLEE